MFDDSQPEDLSTDSSLFRDIYNLLSFPSRDNSCSLIGKSWTSQMPEKEKKRKKFKRVK